MVSRYPLKKNTANQRIVFPILDADGDLVTAAAELDSEYSVDGGEFADMTDEAHEIATSSGMYYLDLAQAETNGDVVAIIVKTSTSGAKTTALVFYTAAQTLDDMQTAITAIDDYVDTEVAAIKAKTDLIGASVALESGGNLATVLADTNELQTDWTDGGRLDLLLDAAKEAVDTEVGAIKAKTDLIGASVALESGGNIATILADTNELQTDWVNGGRLDLLIDAIKAITDALTLAAIADAVHDEAVEGAYTLRELVRLIAATLAGELSGAGTGTLTFTVAGGGANRVVATVDVSNNRTGVVLTP